MSNITDKMSKWRLEGMAYAFVKIKQGGIDSFEKELAWRTPRKCSLMVTGKDVRDFEISVVNRLKDAVGILAMAVLADEFDFGREELQRFRDRFELKCACLDEEYVTWDEQAKILKDENGIEVDISSWGK